VADDGALLAELVRINDTLIWSRDRMDSLVDAASIVGRVTGARLSPVYLLNTAGDRLVLVASPEQRAVIGEEWASLAPASLWIRPPWITPHEWPVPVAEHVDDEGWTCLPAGYRAWVGENAIIVSVHADGRHLGAVVLSFDEPYELDDSRRAFLAAAGRIFGNAAYRWQVTGRERELGALEERRRLSAELHVDLSQQVALVGLKVDMAEMDLAEGNVGQVAADLRELKALSSGLKHSLRHQMLGLRADASETGFVRQVRELTDTFRQQFGSPVELELTSGTKDDVVPLPIAAQLVRVLQEALANVRLHAHASRVVVRLVLSHVLVRLEVEDDGDGFDPTALPDSRLGVRIMAERMHQIDGELWFGRGAHGGTLLVAEAPVRHSDFLSTPAEASP
jgi:signal transduction histidine kinase